MAPAGGARLTAREGRRFGVELAIGFAVLALVALWRAHAVVAQGLGVAAAIAGLAALLVPSHLGPIRAAWMAAGHAIGRVMSPVFFGLVYFLVLTPIGLVRRTFGRSPLRRDPSAPTYWTARPAKSPEALRRSMERYF